MKTVRVVDESAIGSVTGARSELIRRERLATMRVAMAVQRMGLVRDLTLVSKAMFELLSVGNERSRGLHGEVSLRGRRRRLVFAPADRLRGIPRLGDLVVRQAAEFV